MLVLDFGHTVSYLYTCVFAGSNIIIHTASNWRREQFYLLLHLASLLQWNVPWNRSTLQNQILLSISMSVLLSTQSLMTALMTIIESLST